MNISSVIVKIDKESIEEIVQNIAKIEFVEIGLISKENSVIIIAIECERVEQELKILKLIEQTKGVISASMHYSYIEDELTTDIQNLNNYTFNESSIKKVYSGDVNSTIDSILDSKS